jgi:3' exoribonuclease, RNase T-like
MKYFLDTEFIEDGQIIDLVSIGVVCEDGRKYYAINRSCNFSKASKWVKDNVLIHLPPKYPNPQEVSPRIMEESLTWKWRSQIADDLLAFFQPYNEVELWAYYADYDYIVLMQTFGCYVPNWSELSFSGKVKQFFRLCSTYGTGEVYRPAIEACPDGFPFYCRDIKQWCDELGSPELPEQLEDQHNALKDAEWNKLAWEFLDDIRPREVIS